MFNNEQLLVMCNIIAALESEGQVYHTRDTAYGYSNFTEAYANSNIEHAITISRYQFFATEALQLLKLIYSKDKSFFTDELVYDMNNKDWNYYNIRKNSDKAKTIVKIISSKIGKECADELVGKQMQEYAKNAESLGVTDVWSQAMCCQWSHHGGPACVSRILKKTQKPYTIDNLYNATLSDTGNEVGTYQSRQKAAVSLIKQYMPKDSTINNSPTVQKGSDVMSTDIETVNNVVEKAISYMEQIARDDSHGYSQDVRWGPDYDCSSLVITSWQNAGIPVKTKGATYTGNMYSVFKSCGFQDVTSSVNMATAVGMKRGDILLNHAHHVAMYCGNGLEVEASINEYGGEIIITVAKVLRVKKFASCRKC